MWYLIWTFLRENWLYIIYYHKCKGFANAIYNRIYILCIVMPNWERILNDISVFLDRYRVDRNQEIEYTAFISPLELVAQIESISLGR